MQYFVYIITNKRNGTLYIGMTNNLARRVWEHKEGLVEGFSKKYDTKLLVYYEKSNNVSDAIAREKQLKKWKREWKLRIIEKVNPDWGDLSLNLLL
ncbi:MAG: endonuclease [Melioribacteraceae bacterium]|nr:MAG: endonuclease [Melioribacteraceae bacterium]